MPNVLALGDVRTAYELIGRGPLLLLIHGGEADRKMFAGLVDQLKPHFTVLTYDQRDCGDTAAPARAAGLAELADDAHALLSGLGLGPAHVFGASFGGRVAQLLAARHGDAVDRLVLASTWPAAKSLAEVAPDSAHQLAALRQRLPHSSAELAAWFFSDSFLQQRPELRDAFAQVRPDTETSRRRAAAVADLAVVDYAAIRSPTLLLAGECDRIVPPAVTFGMASLIDAVQKDSIPGAGHAIAVEACQALAQCLRRFLTQTGSKPFIPNEETTR